MCNGSIGARGPARIVDRLGIGILPIGIESFEDVVGSFVYVDKTAMIADLVDKRGVTLFCRPRRFGKSLMLRTLQCFFETPVEGWTEHDSAIFDGLAVMSSERRHVAQHAAHPVIYLALNACGGDTWEATKASIARVVSDEYNRHAYLMESPRLSPRDKREFERVWYGEGSDEDVIASLTRLATLLRQHHRSQTVVLIDEYDKIVTEGFLYGYRAQATSFLKRWLTGALKSTVDLYLAALTGVQRVSKESIFSDLNNFRVDTALDHPFSEAFGFTPEEVSALAGHLGHADRSDELSAWYDGYDFGGQAVYNPWSVLCYLDQGCVAQPYWTNTSSNDVVRRLIGRSNVATNAQLTALAEGQHVEAALDLSVVYGQIDSDTSAVWPQLYLAGYVTTHDVAEPNDTSRIRRLEVPNLEVRRLFRSELLDRAYAAAGGRAALKTLHTALSSGDADALARALERALRDSVSYHDLLSENSCHMWLLSLMYGMDGYRFPRSNRETGHGRPDIVCEPEDAHGLGLPAVVVEVKFARDASLGRLQAIAEAALSSQALPRLYAYGLEGDGTVVWGVAFDNHKNVAVALA